MSRKHCGDDVVRSKFRPEAAAGGKFRRLYLGWPTALVLLGLLTTAVTAQDDPFATAPPDREVEDELPSEPTPSAAAEPARPAETDPVVLAVQATNPTTPVELGRALRVMMDLGRWDLARGYLERLQGVELTDEVLRSLYGRFGEAFFVRLMRSAELAPQGAEFGQRVLATASAAARDPSRIADLVQEAADPARRAAAMGTLRGNSASAIAPLLQLLADPARTEQHPAIQEVLVAMPGDVLEPLKAALQAADPQLRQNVIRVLAARREQSAVPHLLGLAYGESATPEVRAAAQRAIHRITGRMPSPADTRRLLAAAFLERWQPAEAALPGQIELWSWDPAQRTVVASKAAVADYGRQQAARLAELLAGLQLENETLQVWKLAAQLELAQSVAGLEASLERADPAMWADAVAQTPARVSAALQFALDSQRPAAAIAAAQVLGRIGGMNQLLPEAGDQFAPLARALNDPNQLVQAAAVDAILAIQPTEGFAGSNRFLEMLDYFLSSDGPRRVLVATPRLDEGRTLIGMLGRMGYAADWAPTGKQALALASAQPDYEFALVSDALDHPAAGEFVQLVRASTRSAKMPVAVMIRDLPVNFPPGLPLPPAEAARAAGTAEEPPAAGSAAPAADANAVAESVGAAAEATPAPEPPVSPYYLPPLTASELREAARYRYEKYEKYARLATEDPLLVAVPRPHSVESLSFIVRRLPQSPGRETVSPERRLARSRRVLRWIAATASSPVAPVYDLLRLEDEVSALIFVPQLADEATAVLGLFSTPSAQQLLVDAASEPTLETAIRTAAASAFEQAALRRGVLLTTDAIQRQYDRYNASETMSRETQQILGTVLDALEAPTLGRLQATAAPGPTTP